MNRFKAYSFDNTIDGVASIDIGLELARIARPVRWAGSMYNLHIKGGLTGECQPPLRCLSQFLSRRKTEIN